MDDRGYTALVNGDLAYIQRIIRRLLTTARLFDQFSGEPVAPPDYIFDPNFGAGLRRMINRAISEDELVRIVTSQIIQDPETSPKVRPKATLRANPGDGTFTLDLVVVRDPTHTIAFGLKLS